jgi:hypothetical protein
MFVSDQSFKAGVVLAANAGQGEDVLHGNRGGATVVRQTKRCSP